MRKSPNSLPSLRRPGEACRAAKSFVWIESGDVKMFNSLVTNARTFIRDSSNPGVMRFDLYGYRRDVSKGTVRMGGDGGLEVDLAARK